MTAAITPHPSSAQQAQDKANAWISQHYDEMVSRARYRLRRVRRRHQEEAIAEVLAAITSCVHSAAERGRLDHVTPFWLVEFNARNFLNGRRNGRTPDCVLAHTTQAKHGFTVTSLDEEPLDDGPGRSPGGLREALADRTSVGPYDQFRIAHDYPAIFDMEDVAEKPRRVFSFLAETDGQGSQSALARELRVSPARITQCKRELGQALSRHDYHGPLVSGRPNPASDGRRENRPQPGRVRLVI